MTGSTSSITENPPVMALVPGSQASQKTKMPDRMTALAYSGIDVVNMEMKEITRSRTDPSRMPASTPRTSAITTMKLKVTPARMAVLPTRFQKISLTGTL